ncbi:dephospho-CoA kinase [Insulibacter thermoxylanivorax]|uniref:Dephospho-CoA kinase n=1 Tax=Insulibacter thermoxylanivorax TaxID=2749268 RepID=A0A916QFP2_9BACL|nr:dephospho-CoA kinase [Insulibacter thermoxylanivorax]GFR38064.1 dephospho-CoA kinase [Insulibacter thermoxylanivorax]
MIIGLTGGIASGKSTVSRMLEERGAIIVDADRISREIVMPGSPVLQTIAEEFGADLIREDGTLDRKLLGAMIFADEHKRLRLNKIMHPPIRAEMQRRISEFESRHPERLIVADIPLLYESNLQHMFPEVMVVYVPMSLQLERLMKRDGLTEKEAMARIRAQMPIEDKRRLADIVIDNSQDLEATAEQLDQFMKRKGLR